MSNTKIDVTQIDLPGSPGDLLASDGTAVTVGSGLTLAGGTLTSTGGTVTTVTASAPLASSGGATPDISLTGVVDVANGGTGLSTVSTAGNILVAQTASTLSSVAVSGDATLSTAGAVTVTGLQTSPVSASAPTAGQFLGWTGAAWAPADVTGGGGFGPGFNYYLEYATAATAPAPASSSLMDFSYSTDPQSNTGAVTVPNSTTQQTLATFVSDPGNPGDVTIPAGLWDLAFYCESSGASNETSFRFLVQTWDGSTATTIATSDDVYITGAPSTVNQYTASAFVPLTDLTGTERLIIVVEGRRWVSNSHSIIGYFQGNTISHVHTTLSAPGGTGVVKVLNGVIQTPASLIVNADVDNAAAIAQSKIANLTTDLASKISGSIAVDQIAFGTGVNTIGGGSNIVRNAVSGGLDVVHPGFGAVSIELAAVQCAGAGGGTLTISTSGLSGRITPGVGQPLDLILTSSLEISGNSGSVGEVLISQGSGLPPVWGPQAASGAAIGVYTAVSSAYSIDVNTDYAVDCTSGTFTVTLPTAVGISGRIFVIKNSGTGVISVNTTSGQTIDGAGSLTISTQYASFTVMSTGANWIII